MTIKLTDQQKIKLLNSDDVYSVMQEILLREEKIDREKEHFWMIGLVANNRIQYIELVSLGSVKATTVEPMNVFRIAVMKGSVSVIMVHNHPSGELLPSDQDKDLTDRLIQVGRILNIAVIDHLIISVKSYLSFADIGLIAELEKSIKWVPQYELIERIRREEKIIREEAIKQEREKAKRALERGKKESLKEGLEKGIEKGLLRGLEKGKFDEKFEVAKAGLRKGLTLEMISDLTGLTREEIEELSK